MAARRRSGRRRSPRTRRRADPSAPADCARSGVSRKCSSMAWKPASISPNRSGPMASIVESPIAESIEYRPPTQSQKPNMLSVSMPNSATPSALVETATKCFAIALWSPSASSVHRRAVWAFVIVSSVVKVFEETMNRVSSGSRSRVASAKSVPSTLETKRNAISRSRVVAQRLVRHHRAEVRPADADVDDVANRLAGMTAPLAASHALAERGHAVEDLVDLLDDVDAVDAERPVAGHAERDVQRRAVLGDVDPLAAEHRLAALRHPAVRRQRGQQLDRLVGDPVLRVVEVEPGALRDQALAATGVRANSVAEARVADLGEVALQRLPGVALGERRRRGNGGHAADFSAWPPNPLRIAESTLSAKSSSPREANLE